MMRKMKIVLIAVFFCLTLLSICSISADEMTVEASSIKLNETKIKLYLGESTQLKVEGVVDTVKWVSSNKKVVKVSSAGKITALKIGKATISAKIGEKTLTCKVKVCSRLSLSDLI